jgi:hypothetical protein
MTEGETKSLNSAATVNLWEMTGKANWNKRKNLLVEELTQNGMVGGSRAAIGFQESSVESVEIIAGLLNFSLENVHMFPSGLSVITDLSVKRESYQGFRKYPDVPLDFGQRGVGLLETELNDKDLIVAVTHFTIAPEIQEKNAVDCIKAIKNFALAGLDEKTALKLKGAKLKDISEFKKILILGDFNAAPSTDAYLKFIEEGMFDATLELRQKGYGFSWPVDAEWFLEIHQKLFNKSPHYEVLEQQRWMDYIWVAGLNPQDTKLLGITKKANLYPSDHSIPFVSF